MGRGELHNSMSVNRKATAFVNRIPLALLTNERSFLPSSGPAINAVDKVAEIVEQAQEICAGDDGSEACAQAWNEVESEKVNSKGKSGDPLEEYCEDNLEADECRVYNY